jgi:hypothetical protein
MAPTPTAFLEIVGDYLPILHAGIDEHEMIVCAVGNRLRVPWRSLSKIAHNPGL